MNADLARLAVSMSLVVGLLACWRFAYPLSDAALFALGALTIIVISTSYRTALRRRRAWVAAALLADSFLVGYLRGHLGAAVAAMVAASAAIPAAAYFALTASPAEWIFILALTSSAALATLAFRRLAERHVREPFLSAVCTPPVVVIIGTVFAAVYVWLAFSVLELPHYLDAESLPDAVMQALRALPPRSHPVAEMLALFRSAEATSWWTMNRINGFRSFAVVIPFLLLKTFICYGLAKVSADVTTYVTEWMSCEEHAHGHSKRRCAGRQ